MTLRWVSCDEVVSRFRHASSAIIGLDDMRRETLAGEMRPDLLKGHPLFMQNRS